MLGGWNGGRLPVLYVTQSTAQTEAKILANKCKTGDVVRDRMLGKLFWMGHEW